MSLSDGLATALGLLTRLPISPKGRVSRGIAWFPVVGGLVGLAAAAVYGLGLLFFPSPLAATVALAATLLFTGAIHEDGLADYSDAIGSRAEPERALEILRDSRVGAFGALALIISLVWRITALSGFGPLEAAAALVLAHTMARSGAAALIGIIPPARENGLGYVSSEASSGARLVAVIIGVVVGAVAAGFWVIPAALVATGVVAYVAKTARRRLGGMTGDVLGACEQLIEISLLTLAISATKVDMPLWTGFL